MKSGNIFFQEIIRRVKNIKHHKVILFLIPFILGYGLSETKIGILGYKAFTFWSPNKTPHILLNRAISAESQIDWATENHTASPVPIGSIGPQKYTAQLKGIIPNIRIAQVMKQAVNDGMNVILVIGDGMGFNQMSLSLYMNLAEGKENPTFFEKIMNQGQTGLVLTNPYDGLVTCSAAAATAIACGEKTLVNSLGVNHDGYPIESAMTLAGKKNYATGLVSDASITDATPAVFYAHTPNRNYESLIAGQLVSNSNVNVILGGGADYFIPKGSHLKDQVELSDFPDQKNSISSRNDSRNLLEEMSKKGYKIINTRQELEKLDPKSQKVLGLFSGGGMYPAIERANTLTDEPSIVTMAEKDLQLLSNTGKKFFTMIECGRIDWEAHDNDAGAVYKAVEEMNNVLEKCYSYYSKHSKNTLLIFTADHETGGLCIPYKKFSHENIIRKQLASGDQYENDTDPLFFSEFLKLKNQKHAVYRIFDKAKNVNELYESLNSDMGYKVTEEDAEQIFNSIHNYKKEK